jgi:hypothetical protein
VSSEPALGRIDDEPGSLRAVPAEIPAGEPGPDEPEDGTPPSDATVASRAQRLVTAEELERLADQAADLDAIVRDELAHLEHEPTSIRNLPGSSVWPAQRRWPARSLVATSVVAIAAIAASNLRGSGVEPLPVPPSRAAPSTPALTTPPPTSTPLRPASLSIGLSFSSPCWVLAVSDGRTVLKGTFDRGVRHVRARHEVRLTLGNAGGVSLTVDGTSVRTGGGSGDVAHLRITLRNGAVSIAR